MVNSSTSKVISFNKNYYKIISNIFQKYIHTNFEDLSFLDDFQTNFEYWT